MTWVMECPHESHHQSLPSQYCPTNQPALEQWHERGRGLPYDGDAARLVYGRAALLHNQVITGERDF